ncbi:hypothetical protein Lysil_0002 [Lysobacter silvestris]|uniref:ATP-grasp domain-containing protein n=2 Tax=Solilutibacter silvestris TaxID=1645665 RepID=A0A2K1Q015_9GAMM|nr:hypothetical protein Lysil_0002 [Lysobacter silvestris]
MRGAIRRKSPSKRTYLDMERIAILIHELAPDPQTYLLGLLMAEWRSMGYDVQVLRGVDRYLSADLLIPHLDMTVVPREYFAFMQRFPRTINASVVDISKSKISTNLLSRDSPYCGPVIVKTDRNFGGMPELRLRSGQHAILGERVNNAVGKLSKLITGEVPWRCIRELKTSEYRVFSSLGNVPRSIFSNKNLVVERFLPERVGTNYAVRYYWFCGDREISYRLTSTQPIIKVSNTVKLEEVPVPPALRTIRKNLGFEFGKFDYVLKDDEVVLFDANRTPGGSFVKHLHCKELHSLGKELCHGIRSLFDGETIMNCARTDGSPVSEGMAS